MVLLLWTEPCTVFDFVPDIMTGGLDGESKS